MSATARATSSTTGRCGSDTSSSGVTSTSATVLPAEERVRVSRREPSSSSSPSRRDSAIRSASWPEVIAVSSSSRGSTPMSRSTPLAVKLNRLITGRITVVNIRNGGTSQIAVLGVSSLGLRTKVLPATRQGATFHAVCSSG